MSELIRILSFFVSIYMIIIFFRIILNWFTGIGRSRFQEILERITDPYLNWFRQFSFLRIGYIDISPIAAIGVLSLVNRMLSILALHGRITIGIILALVLQAIWSAISFILGFLIIVLALRLAAFIFRLNNYHPFWRIVDTISQPVLYRINRIIFKTRIVNFTTGIIVTAVGLGLSYLVLRVLVTLLSGMLERLPV